MWRSIKRRLEENLRFGRLGFSSRLQTFVFELVRARAIFDLLLLKSGAEEQLSIFFGVIVVGLVLSLDLKNLNTLGNLSGR